MRYRIIQLRMYLLFIFFSASLFASAQAKDNEKALLGNWAFENASIAKTKQEKEVSLDLYNSYFKFYAEIEVKDNTVILKNEETAEEVRYEIDGNFIGIEFPDKAIIAEWVILDDKLYLEFDCNHPDNTSIKTKLLVVYKLK